MIRTLSYEERVMIDWPHDQGVPTDGIIRYIARARCYEMKNETGEEVKRALSNFML